MNKMDRYMSMKNGISYLFISRTLAGGGAERFISLLASCLAKRGDQVNLLLYERLDNEYTIDNKVTIRLMRKRKMSIIDKIGRIKEMSDLLKIINPDVIIPFVDTVVICSYLANMLTKKTFIFTVRVSPWHEDGTAFAKLARKLIAKNSSAIMIQNMEQSLFFPRAYRNKIFAVPNPVDELFLMSKGREYHNEITKIIMIGRIEYQKNYKIMIDAIKEIYDSGRKVTVNIFGNGSLEGKLIKYIEDMAMSNIVFYRGRTNNVEEELRKSDLFLMTSDYEGMPNSLMEAMATGIPVVSSDCMTGPKTLIKDGETGFLFNTGNISSLIQKLVYVIDNPNVTNKVGMNGRKFIKERYGLKQTINSFDEMILKIM